MRRASTPPGGRSTRPRNSSWTLSWIMMNESLYDSSAGIDVVFSQVPLTCRKKSSCARTVGSTAAVSIRCAARRP